MPSGDGPAEAISPGGHRRGGGRMDRGDNAGPLFPVSKFAAPDAGPLLSGAVKRLVRRWLASDRAFERAIGWRRAHLKEMHLREHGPLVIDGPFKGMRLAGAWSELPKFLGCYEHDLHAPVMAAAARGYRSVLNIGCAEGYYAIGLARLMPGCTVYAFDIDAEQRRRCAVNAEANGMAARVIVGGAFDGTGFADHPAGATLVVCDIEGAEDVLLDPKRWPALRHFDLLV